MNCSKSINPTARGRIPVSMLDLYEPDGNKAPCETVHHISGKLPAHPGHISPRISRKLYWQAHPMTGRTRRTVGDR